MTDGGRTAASVSFPLLTALVAARAAAGWRAAALVTDLNVGDPGQWMDAGDRILAGSWPYRDWSGIYGPLLYGWGAGWYGLLGADWRAAGLMLEVVSPLAALLLAAAVAAAVIDGRERRGMFLLAVAAIGLDACYWSPALRVWWPLAALAWACGGGRLSFLAGCAGCGAAPLLSPETGAAAVFACWLLIAVTPRRAAQAGRLEGLAALAAPVGLAALLAPDALVRFGRATADLAGVASWVWGVPFPSGAYPLRRLAFLAPFAFTVAFALRAVARFARGRGEPGARRTDVVLAVFTVLVLRAALGRIDVPHLLFAAPPVLLLWFRLAPGVRGGRAAALAAAGALVPLILSAREGQLGRLAHVLAADPRALVPLTGERVRLPRTAAHRLERVTAALRSGAAGGDGILSLPGPLYAHLLRRRNALPLATPEQLAVPGAAAPVLARLDAAPPSRVVIDPALGLPWDDTFLRPGTGPVGDRLTWSTPADEAVTRELRAWLAARYEPTSRVEGAWLLTRRARPLPAPAERVVALLRPSTGAVAGLRRGDVARLPVAVAVCDEVRPTVLCRYPPGLRALAKTYVRVLAVDTSGRAHGGVLPVPPAALGRELHVPVPRVPLARVDLEVGNPGSLNPQPLAVEVPSIRLIRYNP